ncbi:MAG: T9SS type A sorting domain-containing protein [Melioribacteraceae bacterium]|nr:T9SS type A sorting domain-containing protein [Melioribacteraceae bacterium]
MKILLRIFILLILSTTAKGQWEWQNPLPQGNTLNDISYMNSNYNYSWAVGEGGTILRQVLLTNYTVQESGTTENLNGVFTLDENNCVVVGDGGTILKTTDAGNSWTQKTSGVTQNLNKVYFVDGNNGYAIGDYYYVSEITTWFSVVLKTTDGGNIWTEVSISGSSNSLSGIDFYSVNVGWVCGGTTIYKTTDGGETWVAQVPGISSDFIPALDAVDLNTIYAIGYYNKFLKSTDGGDSWSIVSNAVASYLLDIEFSDNVTGYITNQNGEVYKTTSSGASWTKIADYVAGNQFNCLDVYNPNLVFFAGIGGVIWLYNGTSMSKIYQSDLANNSALFDIQFINTSSGVAGSYNSFIKTTNGGENWTEISVGSGTVQFGGSYFHSMNLGWLVGRYNSHPYAAQIYKTTDGGSNWSYKNYNWILPTGVAFYAIDFYDSNFGCTVGSGSFYANTTNGGTDWTTNTISGASDLTAVQCLSSSLFFTVGISGVFSKSTDGGSTWATLIVDATADFLDVYFINSSTGWIVGDAGEIYKTTNSGSSWTLKTSGTTNRLNSIHFYDVNTGWVCGNNGELLLTSDGGSTWEIHSSGTTNNLSDVFFLSNLEGWMVGGYGTILHSEDGGMPVELTTFTANLINGNVNLAWETATEVNNYGFEIERARLRPENRDFAGATWQTIAFVEGAGNSNSPKKYNFIDESPNGETIQYRLKQIDLDGSFEYSEVVIVTVENSLNIPTDFVLEQNYPNPFNPSTTIKYSVPKIINNQSSIIILKVYDVLGNEIATLVNEEKTAGTYEVKFETSSFNREISSGIYFYKITYGSNFITKKMMLLK